MLFEQMREDVLYSGQKSLFLPKGEKIGHGEALFVLTPNIEKSKELIESMYIRFQSSYYKRYLVDPYYRQKIGKKVLLLNENSKMKKEFSRFKMPLIYTPYSSRKTVLNAGRNVVVDLGRWHELYFLYRLKPSARKMCEAYLDFLHQHTLGDSNFEAYKKTLLIDIPLWTPKATDCIVFSKNGLVNPLSILLYAAYRYPDLLEKLQGLKLILCNSISKQILITDLGDMNKRKLQNLKTKIKLFKGVQISPEAEEEAHTPMSPTKQKEAIQAEEKVIIYDNFKTALTTSLKSQLVGEPQKALFKEEIIGEISDDEVPEGNMGTEKADVVDTLNDAIDTEIEENVKTYLEKNPTAAETELPEEIAQKLAPDIKKKVYTSSFMPTRNEKEIERVKRLTKDQQIVLPTLSLDDIKSKVVETTDLTAAVETKNPNITKARFMNFDKNYNEKKMEDDIDNAVKILSRASQAIFVTGKEVEDTSDPQNLKYTYTYRLEDEKGNRSTIRFDIPKIIDHSYIFLNGSKKLIGHQFILKPIVKTGPDTVQVVTEYNKVFIRRKGRVDMNSAMVQTYLDKHPDEFKIRYGNSLMKNTEYETSLDFDSYAKMFHEFRIGPNVFILEMEDCIKRVKKLYPTATFNKKGEYPIGYSTKSKSFLTLPYGESFTTKLWKEFFSEDQVKEISKIKRKPKLLMATAKMLRKDIPLILFMLHCEGFTTTMQKCGITYKFIDQKELRSVDKMKWGSAVLEDCVLIWDKTQMSHDILMNGFTAIRTELYSKEDLDNKDTYVYLVNQFYGSSNSSYGLDNYKDFLLGDVTKEILMDYGYPTDLLPLLMVATEMLCDNKFLPENDMHNMRIRSNEIISNIVYCQMTYAYRSYRNTAYKKKPTMPSIKRSAIIDDLLSSDTNLVAEDSTLNPVLELEKQRSVTFRGIRGIQKDRAMTLSRRGYDKSMLGVVGISTNADANVGIVRQLTLEPSITSTRGYIDVKSDDLDNLTDANLFTPAELLTPLGVIHDDPDRTSMSYKQTKQMVSVADADPVLIGNGVEKLIPYQLSDEFVVDAKEDGEVIDRTKDFVVIRYKSGTNYCIDISPRIRKNASAGFFVDNDLTCTLQVGDRFRKGDVLARNDKAFAASENGKGAIMKLGVFCKIAIASSWDIYEDSTPITSKLSQRLATDMIGAKKIILEPNTYIDYIVSVGQKINTGDTLLRFNRAEDAEMSKFLQNIREESERNAIIEETRTTIRSKYTGEIADIAIYSTVELEEMDPSLATIVKAYYKKIDSRNKTLNKYANKGDLEYYKAGQIITTTSEVMTVGKNRKINGEYMDQHVQIVFYIRYTDLAAKGDKVCAQFALKGTISHVMDEKLEPYSEYRPDEEISTIVAPLAVSARKTPSIFITMFGNKVLVELKRQLKEMWYRE